MARLFQSALFFWVWCLVALVHSAPTLEQRQFPGGPGVDPWYNPPAGFESKAPGSILRERRVVASFFGFLPAPVETFQLLYRTTAVNGSAIATATTIFKPFFAKKDRFISFQTAYDSAAPKCSPSYTYQLGTPPQELIGSAEFLIIQAYLASGYIVASSDYEGPDAAFPVGRLEGLAALDGMRAVTNYYKNLGLTTSKPAIVGVGYSGGSVGTSWSASLLNSYAPELNVKGWVAGGVPANLSAEVYFIDNTISSGFIPVAIAGLSKPSTYKAQLQPIIDRIITPRGRSLIDFANNNCGVAALGNFFKQSIFSTTVQSLGKELLNEPTIARILAQNVLGVNAQEAPRAPVYLYHATQDEIVPYSPTQTLNGAWCSQGSTVQFATYAAGGHVTTEVLALPNALAFTAKAFAGTIAPGCTTKTELGETLNPVALGANLEPLGVKLIEVLLAAGSQDANIKADISNWGKRV